MNVTVQYHNADNPNEALKQLLKVHISVPPHVRDQHQSLHWSQTTLYFVSGSSSEVCVCTLACSELILIWASVAGNFSSCFFRAIHHCLDLQKNQILNLSNVDTRRDSHNLKRLTGKQKYILQYYCWLLVWWFLQFPEKQQSFVSLFPKSKYLLLVQRACL